MKLYYHPASTTCRPILLLAAAEQIDLDYQLIDVFSGENLKEEYIRINPNGAVPLLEDGDFRMAESSAILKYLAEKSRSSAYPADPRKRARVNERMDWFNTGLYRDLGYGFIYPQVIPGYGYTDAPVQSTTLAHAREKSKKWLRILDQHIIGPAHDYVCGDQLTLADFMGACYITAGEVIHLNYAAYPNLLRWLKNIKALPYWAKTNETFYAAFVTPFKDRSFEGL